MISFEMVDTGGTLHTAYISELGAKVGNYFGVVDSYGEVAMKHLFLGLDIQLCVCRWQDASISSV